jgi:MFS family permease
MMGNSMSMMCNAILDARTSVGSGVASKCKTVLMIFLPFALGYYLSYMFRTINAVIAPNLIADLGLDASRLGFLTSAYFLTFAAVQLPLGAAFDRYGPRKVQGVLLLVAAIGAVIFSSSTTYPTLVLGRLLIGLGVAGAMAAGLKAFIESFPKDRLPLVNGLFVACGAAGAVTATTPAEWALQHMQWRTLFMVLAACTAAAALFVTAFTPDNRTRSNSERSASKELLAIYCDPFFWRLAPLSATCIGTAWALQGLWAGPWLTDVAALNRTTVVHDLFIMAVALCLGAALIGVVADRLKKKGIETDLLLGGVATIFIAAETSLILHARVPLIAPWTIISATGAATVLSYAILANRFPKQIAGKANAALNVLHIGGAFLIQTVIGVILDQWPRDALGHYPSRAYAVAFGLVVFLQLAALIWFVLPAGVRVPGGAPVLVPVRR